MILLHCDEKGCQTLVCDASSDTRKVQHNKVRSHEKKNFKQTRGTNKTNNLTYLVFSGLKLADLDLNGGLIGLGVFRHFVGDVIWVVWCRKDEAGRGGQKEEISLADLGGAGA